MPVIADILWSDTHVGHKSGLIWPDPNAEYRPSQTQRWLWKAWNTWLEDVEKLLKKYKPKYVHGLAGGDMGDLDYKGRGQSEYWAHTSDQVVENCAELFDPLVKLCDDVHWIMGNDAHVGKDGTLDNSIAKSFDNSVPHDKDRNLYAHPALDYELSGKLINVTHKGANRTKWTGVNGLVSLSREVALDRALANERVPDVIVRGHFHYGAQIRDIRPMPVAISSFQAKSDYIRYIDRTDSTPQVGGHVMIWDDGELLFSEPMLYTLERQKAWKPK